MFAFGATYGGSTSEIFGGGVTYANAHTGHTHTCTCGHKGKRRIKITEVNGDTYRFIANFSGP